MTEADIPHAIVMGMSEAVLALDVQDEICWANPAAVALFGYELEQIRGLAIDQLLAEQDLLTLTGIRCAFSDAGSSEINILFRARDGTLLPTTTGGRVVRGERPGQPDLILVIRDGRRIYSLMNQASKDIVTERERLTEAVELRHAQKLMALGQLAAGLAHEINTPIQFITDSVAFLQDAFADLFATLDDHDSLAGAVAAGTASPAMAEAMRAAATERDLDYVRREGPPAMARTLEGLARMASIVRAMTDLNQSPTGSSSAVDVNAIIKNALLVVGSEYRPVADVETALGTLPWIVGCKSDLGQLMINLIVNAAHAVADVVTRTGIRGSIRIATELDGQDVVIRISDTGGGIPANMVERIFEPFFTTKEVGRGSGQGLAISRSIVHRHRGAITVESRPGEGTTFTVQLPAAA